MINIKEVTIINNREEVCASFKINEDSGRIVDVLYNNEYDVLIDGKSIRRYGESDN